MVESNQPIMPSTSAPVSVNSAKYVEVFKWNADPNRKVYIRDISIVVSAVTTHPTFIIQINGEDKLKDFETLATSFSFGFGDHLVFRGHEKKPTIRVLAKNDASAGVNVTVAVHGVEEPMNG